MMNVKYISESEIEIDGTNRYELTESNNYSIEFDRKKWVLITKDSLQEKFNLKLQQLQSLQNELLILENQIENTKSGKYYFICSSAVAFDDDGDCIIPQLPFAHMSDLSKIEDEGKQIPDEALPEEIRKWKQEQNIMSSYSLQHDTFSGLISVFCKDLAIHNFFVQG